MKELFVTYEIAIKLKALGFTEPCLAYYGKSLIGELIGNIWNGYPIELSLPDNSIHVDAYAPLWQQVIDWFREKHRIMIVVDFYTNGSRENTTLEYHFKISEPNTWHEQDIFVRSDFKTYADAQAKAIELALTLL